MRKEHTVGSCRLYEELTARRIFDDFPNRTSKRFGQNFLFDEKINRKVTDSAGILVNKVIMEVGPGPGGLTLEILKQPIKKLYAIEIDSHWCSVWRELSPMFKGKLEIIPGDALKINFKDIASQVVISNLPYNISAPLLLKWLNEAHRYERLILMFQKEVADRIRAAPATKAYGRLSVLAQWKSHVEKMFDIEPGSFFPAPEVRSTVLRFSPYPKDQVTGDFQMFSSMLIHAFEHRRKYVSKSLNKLFPNAKQILCDLGYGPRTRAEEISVADYVSLFKGLK
ncbi:MAG: 16S rRNA (adenine(1518)-N(6)/adenine(1519)-N(6))-dimethyltransferase RsmA [Holosporaceae bacterium]|jgi:16S rRNA (adenine1518-N6/adenine1519-N6)-dimethyltransferase|nr:16S rRNA (adenine(1518)-N(6)/adenine(1519)-N(6))-dimethyltransferase RsmA [Holosporaceae bacterium]